MGKMAVAGLVEMVCAMPVCFATGKTCVSDAGDPRRFDAGVAAILD